MPQVKNIFGDLYTFALRVHSNGETPILKILENRVLGHILPRTMYLAKDSMLWIFGVSPDGNCATSIEVLLRPTQSAEPSDLRGSLSVTTAQVYDTAPGSPRRSPIQL